MMKLFIFLCFTISIIYVNSLCLDSSPPFETTNHSRFCSNYKKYSCCTNDHDKHLSLKYLRIFQFRLQFQPHFNEAYYKGCNHYVRDLLCTRCDPHAANIFASDSNHVNSLRRFPGLCYDYCERFFDNCRAEIIPHLTEDKRLVDAPNASAFCRLVSSDDSDYCFPNILSQNRVNAELHTAEADNTDGCLCLQEVADNLRNPTFGTFIKAKTDRFYILEQIGLIRIYADDWQLLPQIFLDIQDRVFVSTSLGDERGLLGLAFHPNYERNRKFYVYYTTLNEDKRNMIRISQFKAFSNGLQGDPSSERIMRELTKPNNFANHNGGMMMFGTDGYLYAFIGDGGGAGDPYGLGQNKSVLFGKAIRLDVNLPHDSQDLFRIPSSNPFTREHSAAPEVFAYGLREPWRCSVDRGDTLSGEGRGRIFCGDVGQSAFEEVNIIENGKNYGWPDKEGLECYDRQLCATLTDDTLPIHAYNHNQGKSVIGGYVYRGCKNPSFKGIYIYGDYVKKRLFGLQETGQGTWENKQINMCKKCRDGLINAFDAHILSFAEDFEGELYALVTSRASSQSREGKVYKLIEHVHKFSGSMKNCRYSLPV